MRNRWLLVIGSAITVFGFVALMAHAVWTVALYIIGMGVLLVLGGLLVGPRYTKELKAPPEGYVATGEYFKDPGSGRMVSVWEHPGTGDRAYVLDRANNGGDA